MPIVHRKVPAIVASLGLFMFGVLFFYVGFLGLDLVNKTLDYKWWGVFTVFKLSGSIHFQSALLGIIGTVFILVSICLIVTITHSKKNG
jgi:hypothetical protein